MLREFTEVRGHRLANTQEVAVFEYLVGNKTLAYLNSIGAPLYIDEHIQNIPSKYTNAGPDSMQQMLGLVFKNYLRTDFATVVDGRIIWMITFEKREQCTEEKLPSKVIQIDFMFQHDWESGANLDESYKNKKHYQETLPRNTTKKHYQETLPRNTTKKHKERDCIVMQYLS